MQPLRCFGTGATGAYTCKQHNHNIRSTTHRPVLPTTAHKNKQASMTLIQFLEKVLPSEGYYVTTIVNPGNRRMQGSFDTIDKLAKVMVRLNELGNNVHYALSSFVEKGNRTQDNVLATKCVAFDVDCGKGKPYSTWKEGLKATGEFVALMGLPKPMVVHSGSGLHVYWVLTEELESQRWKPLAQAMKSAALNNGFEIDPSTPADSSRVLRPIGTINRKNGNTVKLLIDAQPSTVDELSSCVSTYLMTPTTVPPKSKSASGLSASLAVQQDFPPTNSAVVTAKCQQISWAVKNQKDVDEPLWYALLGIAAYCHDDVATALAWSDQHPDFDQNETVRKLHHWKQATTGPTTCNRFEDLRPDGCKGCKFKDKVGSPARLGIQYLEVAPPASAPDNVASTIPLPKPFKRTTDGIKLVVDGTDIDVCKFDIYPVSYGKDETLGYETVRYHWNRPHAGWQELVLRQAMLTDGHREFATAIADQGIVLNNKTQTGYFQIMLRSYMDELRNKRAMTNLYATMGWKDNFSQFVIGDTILRRNPDGTVGEESICLASGSSRLGHELWSTSGSLSAWTGFTSLIDKADLRAHAFALSVGLSAPLYAFTGLKGLTISLYGPTGGGKSLAQQWIQSIYGNPDKLHFAAKFTQNSLFGRMGLYSHMPMTIDEVTMMDNKEVGDFAYWVSQGRDKARMNRNAEERDAKTWSMPVVVSTNKSMTSKLVASGLDTDAQLARILEVNVPPSKIFTRNSSGGRKVYEFINENYGHVGKAFITRLLELGESGVRAAIAQATADFHNKYKTNFSGEERYWEQALILADLAAKLAKDWGLIAFDHTNGIDWVLAQIGAIRRTVAEFKTDSFDLLTEYLNENVDATITVTQTGTNKPIVDFNRLPRGEIRVRFELRRATSGDAYSHGVVLLDRTHFRRWIAVRGSDYKTFVSELQTENIIATPKSNKVYMGKNSPIKLGQSYVIGVNLNHPRLQGILNDADQATEDLVYGKLKLV